MALQGDVRTIPVRELLAWLARRRATGTLSLSRGMEVWRFQLRAGRLTEELEPPGFEALAGMTPARAPSKRAGTAKAKPSGVAQARQRVQEAQRDVREREREAVEAEREAERTEMTAAEARRSANAARGRSDEAERALAEAEAALRKARRR